MARGRARQRRRRARGMTAALAAAAAAAAAVTVTALPVGSHPAGPVASARLAAWTVTRKADGDINVTINELSDPAGLQSTLRADGVPASVTFLSRPNPACSPLGFGPGLLGKIFPEPASGVVHHRGQHTTPIPAAFGHTSVPTELCGYTVSQLRSAYGISASPYTGKGATIAVVLDGYSPTMLADANRFFAGQGVPGFAPGQYTEDFGGDGESASALGASCDNEPDQPEEALDVETAHIAAADAHVVYMGSDCAGDGEQNFLDTMTSIVDHHLADVVTDSYSIIESQFSPADVAAWSLTFEQGALEGIGFNFDSGDGGNYGDGVGGAQFPASDPWATAVGGTSLEIGAHGTPVAQYGWGDGFTQENAAGTGYLEPLPDGGSDGSQGGLSTFFAEPSYQKGVVPAALATDDGTIPAARVVPDIAADAGSHWLIGYTGAITSGVYGQVAMGGGTSGASPLVSGLEADAEQASGHAVGFANPAIYQLAGTPAIHDILPVNLNDPPLVFGPIPDDLQSADNYLIALGQDDGAEPGYDAVTGVGAATPAFVTAFGSPFQGAHGRR